MMCVIHLSSVSTFSVLSHRKYRVTAVKVDVVRKIIAVYSAKPAKPISFVG